MEYMKRLTWKEIMKIVCAPIAIDEPKELDFIDGDEISEAEFVKRLIAEELS